MADYDWCSWAAAAGQLHLQQPFWRFHIDTAEPDGQFEILLKAEQDGAGVFYIAPKFHDWNFYLGAFEHKQVLSTSLILSPVEIRRVLVDNGVPDGDHKIVYDGNRAYLCSEPLALNSSSASEVAGALRADVESRELPIANVLENIFNGFDDRADLRRPHGTEVKDDPERRIYAIASEDGRQPELRRGRLNRMIASGRSREEAIALAVGAEAWSAGAQLIFITTNK